MDSLYLLLEKTTFYTGISCINHYIIEITLFNKPHLVKQVPTVNESDLKRLICI